MATLTYYRLDEAADLLKVHPQTLRRWIREGRLSARRFGKQYRLRLEDIERAAEAVGPVGVAKPDEEVDGFDRLSLTALHDLWDNDEDAIYDNWRELYGVSER